MDPTNIGNIYRKMRRVCLKIWTILHERGNEYLQWRKYTLVENFLLLKLVIKVFSSWFNLFGTGIRIEPYWSAIYTINISAASALKITLTDRSLIAAMLKA